MKVRDEHDAELVAKVKRCLTTARDESHSGNLQNLWGVMLHRLNEIVEPQSQATSSSASDMAPPITSA